MKRVLMFAFVFIILLLDVICALPNPKSFDIKFSKNGTTSLHLCSAANGSLNESEFINLIEFSMYDESEPDTMPYAEFGIVWNLYSGTSYDITMTCVSSLDGGDHMLVSSSDGTISYLDYDVNVSGLPSASSTFNWEYSSGAMNDTRIYSGTREPYTQESGTAYVKLEMQPNLDSEGNNVYMGDYSGYITVKLNSNE